jgi:hypothetical protein
MGTIFLSRGKARDWPNRKVSILLLQSEQLMKSAPDNLLLLESQSLGAGLLSQKGGDFVYGVIAP